MYLPPTSRAVATRSARAWPSIPGMHAQPGLALNAAAVCYSAVDAGIGLALQCLESPRIRPSPAARVGSATARVGPSIAGMPAQPDMGSAAVAAAAAAVQDSAAAAVAGGGTGRTVHRR